MSGKHSCADCQDSDREAVLTVRTRFLCRDCFIKYVNIKVFRRMDRYNPRRNSPRDEQRKLLLPLSFGVSSSVLLHILSHQLERQAAGGRGRVAYNLHVLAVDPSNPSASIPPCNDKFALIQKHYPMHTYSRLPLDAIFQYDEEMKDITSHFAGPAWVNAQSMSNQDRLESFRSAIQTATSKDDVDHLLLNRLIVAFAKRFGCEAVIWGDSDTRLAAKTLANVAKGRGSSLTWQVCDGLSPWGVSFGFPLRDLYKQELQFYGSQVPTLEEVIVPERPVTESTSSRNLSIDGLMSQYVQKQGGKYPGVMANVVRTVNKLQPASISRDQKRCALCATILDGNPAVSTKSDDNSHQFCYSCLRSQPPQLHR